MNNEPQNGNFLTAVTAVPIEDRDKNAPEHSFSYIRTKTQI